MIKLAPYPFSLSVLLNANYADGIDTSWIWDADFEQITDMDIPEINAGGVRHSEIARRLRVTGYPADKITETSSLEQVLKTIEGSRLQACLYPCDLYGYARIPRITS